MTRNLLLLSFILVGVMSVQTVDTPSAMAGEKGTGMLFTEVTEEAGIAGTHAPLPPRDTGASRPFEEYSWIPGGAAAEDFDGDGWIDLFVTQGGISPTLLYRNNGDGTFTEEGVARGAAIDSNQTVGAAAADYDNDGDIDLVVTTEYGPHHLLVNQGNGTFLDDTTQVLTPNFAVTSPSWGDIDNDGLLDLVIGEWDGLQTNEQALYVYRNVGGGTLESSDFTSDLSASRLIFSPRFSDLDGDRYADLAVVSDFGNSRLFLNDGTGFFQEVTEESNIGTDENGMGSAIGDYDNDGDMDWFVSSIWDETQVTGLGWGVTGNRLFQNDGKAVFTDVTDAAGVRDGNWGWGSVFGDYDLDGDLDLFHVNGWSATASPGFGYLKFDRQPARLFENDGGGVYEEVAASANLIETGQGRGTLSLDYDNDGDLDLFVVNNHILEASGEDFIRSPAPFSLHRNDTPSAGHWLKVHLRGQPPYHRFGVGSRAVVTREGGATQTRELHASTHFMATGPDRIGHFGLGEASTASSVKAEWNRGVDVIVYDIPADGTVEIPSPRAVVSDPRPEIGDMVTFDGSAVPPLENPRRWSWTGDGNLRDPTLIAFENTGTFEVQLDILDTQSGQPIYSEVYHIEVVPVGGVPTPTPTPTESDSDIEATPTLSPTPGGTPVNPRSDINEDQVVDEKDLMILMGDWKQQVLQER
jgi:hypothetical protein